MGSRRIRRLVIAAASLALAAAAAACSGGGGSSQAAPKGTPQQGGTVRVAWTGATPNFIFPLPPATNTNGYNINLTQPLWPAIVYNGDGAQATVNARESLYSKLDFSPDGKTITIVFKPWSWSDGAPITSRDFTFVFNLLKAAAPDWFSYLPGLFPDNVASVKATDTHTAVITLTKSFNPAFYTQDVLSLVPLLPQHAWDKTSADGTAGDYDLTTKGAKAVVAFLRKEGGDIATFTTNPLWQVTDGPWKLSEFTSTGLYSYVPNPKYSGPDKPKLAKVVNLPFTDSTASFNALRAGSTVDVAALPLNNVKQIPVLKSQGYSTGSFPIPGVAGIYPNFWNAQTGPVVSQLYIRQALEELVNRPQIVDKIYNGYADPGNGPVPVSGFAQWVSPLEKSGGPYPYNPSAAIALLRAHGWNVVPNGSTTCAQPGTGPAQCGAGISAGQPLSFQLLYSSGRATTDATVAAIQSSQAQAGIKLAVKPEPFDTLASTVGLCTRKSHATGCGWQLVMFGYTPYNGPYPTGSGIFDTGGASNQGGYSDPKMDQLIQATEYGSDTATFFQYEDYAARQLPMLWLPLRSEVEVYRSSLAGFIPLNPFSGGLNPQVWYYTK